MIRYLVSIAFLFLVFCNFTQSFGCSGWGHIDRVNNNTILAKNRDEIVSAQAVKLYKPAFGKKYIGLFAQIPDGNFITKAGIIENGLVVTSLSISTLFHKHILKCPGDRKHSEVIKAMLENYNSVDEVLNDADNLFNHTEPVVYMLADKSKIRYVEVAPKPNYKCDGNTTLNKYYIGKEDNSGYIWHTNHYRAIEAQQYNEKEYISTYIRLNRIEELLKGVTNSNTIEKYLEYAHDEANGPNNSLFRYNVGDKLEKTLATWLVKIPHDNSAPVLNVTMYQYVLVNQNITKTVKVDSINHQIELNNSAFDYFEPIYGRPTVCKISRK